MNCTGWLPYVFQGSHGNGPVRLFEDIMRNIGYMRIDDQSGDDFRKTGGIRMPRYSYGYHALFS